MGSVQVETVHVNGFTMDCLRFGSGERPLVILPGLSVESITTYAFVLPISYAPLMQDFSLYVFDRRKELPAAYTVHQMAEDTVAAIRALGLDRVSMFGASQGGMMAMSIATEHPELVGKLVLGSTAPCMGPEEYVTVNRWVELAKGGDAAGLYRAFGEAIYPPETFERTRGFFERCAKNVTGEDLARFVTLAEGMKGFDVRDRLHNVTCPVLVTGSHDDRVVGAGATEEIVRMLRQSAHVELHMYDGYGHAAYDTAPDYKERMLRFLVS